MGSEAAFAWLIEAPGQRYLAVRNITNYFDFHWTQDHNVALRFYTREQADDVMMAIKTISPSLFEFARTLGDARAVEHGWLP
jgi:hypothetical protein